MLIDILLLKVCDQKLPVRKLFFEVHQSEQPGERILRKNNVTVCCQDILNNNCNADKLWISIDKTAGVERRYMHNVVD